MEISDEEEVKKKTTPKEDVIKTKFSFLLEGCTIQLKNGAGDHFSPITDISFYHMKVGIVARKEYFSMIGKLESMVMNDYHTLKDKQIKTIFPAFDLTESLLKFEFYNPPIDRSSSKYIGVEFKPLDIYVSPKLINKIISFFNPPEIKEILDVFSRIFSEKFQGFKKEAEEQLKEAIKKKISKKKKKHSISKSMLMHQTLFFLPILKSLILLLLLLF